MNTITIAAIPAFNDNYIWAITNKENNTLALVDPGELKPCLAFIKQHNLTLTDILVTHHHNDHVGAIKGLVESFPQEITVYGPANEKIPCLTIALVENDTFSLSQLGIELKTFDVPGHTSGHIAYTYKDNLFCGDTLFSGGCGRLFEGTPSQMLSSLNKFSALPPETKVYCAHEYTLANLNFALAVDPNNADLLNYHSQVVAKRENNQATIPSSIGLELKINPFLRTNDLNIKQSAQEYQGQPITSQQEIFATIRSWKDSF